MWPRGPVTGALALLFFSAAPAFAHSGFLVPILDESDTSGEVLLNATFSDAFPEMDIALRSDVWTIITPSGEHVEFERVVSTSTRTVLSACLSESGTYRLSSGERLGRMGEVALIDGQFVRLGSDGLSKDKLPEGASILTSQTATVSDIYISRGPATAGALESRIGTLAIMPSGDPAEFSIGDTFSATIAFGEAGLAGVPVTVFVPGGSREEGHPETTLLTDAQGRVSFTCQVEGAHLLMVRHIAFAPEGAGTDVRSHTTTLTLMCD